MSSIPHISRPPLYDPNMTDATSSDDHDALDALYNSTHPARFVRRSPQGDFLFAIDGADGVEARVIEEEYASTSEPSPGDEVTLLVERPVTDTLWAASVRKAEKLAQYDELARMAKEKETLEGLIVSSNKGGLSVDAGVRAFVPWSHVDIHRVHDATPYIGRTETFEVIEFDPKDCQLVLSRANLLKRHQKVERKETIEQLEKGAIFEGVVRSNRHYGSFVDIGGIQGLLHVSNMSWGRIDHPDELVRPGDTITVVVLDYDKKRDRLSLGRKQLLDDPWEGIDSRYEEGDEISGRVVSLADFGAFIEIMPGLEGLVHVTELAWVGRINHPKDVLEIGQNVGVKIISIDTENKRLGLSIKQLEENPWEVLAQTLSEGAKLSGPVRSVTDFGAFVEVAPGVEGLVHVSNISWTERNIDPQTFFTVGERVETLLISIDPEAQRLDLGIKQLTVDPWEHILEIARPGQKVEATITRVVEFGAFAQIAQGVEGLIHVSELSEDRVEDPAHVVRPGQKVEALVLSVDRANERIALSLKRDALEEEGMKSYVEDDMTTGALGDLLRAQLGLSSGAHAEEE